MKKLRFFAPVMATVAALTPATALLSSCGKINYTEIVSEIKDEAMSIFMEIAKTTHRASWDEGEVFAYIDKYMSKLNIQPAGQDYWSTIPEVKAKIESELTNKYPGRPMPGEKKYEDFGNIWYDLPASEGMENVPKLIITGHMDCSMAFNSDEDKTKWIAATDDIINVTYDRDYEILKTDKKTSLGADDGLGIGAMLALAKSRNNFKHGEIRLIFTAGESESTENYSSGADFLYNDQLYDGQLTDKDKKIVPGSKNYMDLTSKKPFGEKDEYPYIVSTSGIYKNAVYSSTAGIHDCEVADYDSLMLDKTDGDFTVNNTIDWTGESLNLFTIHLDNLKGGQSGKNINSGYVNALQMLMQMLFTGDYHTRLISAYSKPGSRAIPTQAEAIFATTKSKDEIDTKVNLIIDKYKACYPNDDWDNFTHTVTLHNEDQKNYNYSFSPKQTRAITKLMGFELLYGPVDYFDTEHTKVKTSCNFCDLDFGASQDPTKTSHFHMHNVCRSADVDTLYYFHYTASEVLYDAFETLYEFNATKPAAEGHSAAWWTAKSKATHMSKPVWEKSDDDKMVKLACEGYNNLGISPIVWENHGWVDIAAAPLVYSDAFGTTPQITCLGPEIRQSHEVDEEVWTDTLTTCLGSLMYVIDHMKNL